MGRVGRIVGSILLGVLGLGVGAIAVSALREATLSTHQPVSPGSKVEVTVHARVHNTEQHQTLEEHVEAQLLACRLEVSSDIIEEGAEERAEPQVEGGEGTFTFVMQPQLDQTNRRQFKGCVEDFVVDGLQMDVVEMKDVT
jgi:hypothetical protein